MAVTKTDAKIAIITGMTFGLATLILRELIKRVEIQK